MRGHVAKARKVIMFAVQFGEFGPPGVLTVGPLPAPHAEPGEVRIRVRAAGVSPVDIALRAGLSPASRKITLPHIPGVDASGVIDEVGAGVTGVTTGDEVFGAVDVARLGGASAEFAVLQFWAAKPTSMSWEEAGAAGTSIETATRALTALEVHDGTVLLVDGAAGGVGSIAVQLAIACGARVIGTGRPESRDFIAGLGAVPTTYGPGLPERVRAAGFGRVDRALDVAGAGSLPQLIAITGTAASVLTIVDFTGQELGVRVSLGRLGGEPDGCHGLAAAAVLSENGRFRVPLREVFPMARAAEAHALAAQGPRHGKIALTALQDRDGQHWLFWHPGPGPYTFWRLGFRQSGVGSAARRVPVRAARKTAADQ
jgi:NADPH:quinone reductase-like Zn-dependent oxidoreductase